MAQPKPPRGGPSIGLIIISILLVIVGVYSFQSALFTDVSDVTRFLFLVMFVLSFGFVIFSMRRVRRGYSITRIVPYKVLSIVKCAQCSFKQIKNFAVGDYVTKTEGKCTQCGVGDLSINGIYTEGPPKR
ncbi:MAG TPA: hypothetical protein VFE98_00610 [Candidatus Bathyarchaeia archaeon]|nr:hypothetical protein [Candidatus Bathyarchaeia archaeon]